MSLILQYKGAARDLQPVPGLEARRRWSSEREVVSDASEGGSVGLQGGGATKKKMIHPASSDSPPPLFWASPRIISHKVPPICCEFDPSMSDRSEAYCDQRQSTVDMLP